ncbi:MAG: hypothetical protein SF052_15560 [Bacteroidia bacterium]|nr:hypothetical protein [Bacteroidia bacterium]
MSNMSVNKPKVVKDFEKLSEELLERLHLAYPDGFSNHLIRYQNADGKSVRALPFETEDRYYLIRMPLAEVKEIPENDDDFDDSANVKDDMKEGYGEGDGDGDGEDGYTDYSGDNEPADDYDDY